MRNLKVKKVCGMGRGVFAAQDFKFRQVIERCNVILIPNKVGSRSNPTREYSFRWDEEHVAISLGHGSLYNHSYDPNAYVLQNEKDMQMVLYALKPIKAGEQIFINYNGEPDCEDPLWF